MWSPKKTMWSPKKTMWSPQKTMWSPKKPCDPPKFAQVLWICPLLYQVAEKKISKMINTILQGLNYPFTYLWCLSFKLMMIIKLLLFIACWRKWYVHAMHFLLVTGGPLDVMEHLNTPPASEPSTKRVRSSWENDILVTESERTQSNSAKL